MVMSMDEISDVLFCICKSRCDTQKNSCIWQDKKYSKLKRSLLEFKSILKRQ